MEKLVVHAMLLKLQEGNTDAAGVLYAHVAEELRSIAKAKYRLCEDEAQDALLKMINNVVRSCNTYNPERQNQATGWVAKIFNNAVQDVLREKKRREENERLTVSIDELAEEDIATADILKPKKDRSEEAPEPAEYSDEPGSISLLARGVENILLQETDLCHPEKYYIDVETRKAVQEFLRQGSVASDLHAILTKWPKRGPKSGELKKELVRMSQLFEEFYPGEGK